MDYVSGWFMKAAQFGKHTNSSSAFVSTNSICQGQQVAILRPLIFNTGSQISFAYTSFKWANLASYNAGVTVAIIGFSNPKKTVKRLFSQNADGQVIEKQTSNINAYLVAGKNAEVEQTRKPISRGFRNVIWQYAKRWWSFCYTWNRKR